MAGSMKRGAKGTTAKSTVDVPITIETTLSQGGLAKRSASSSGEKATTRAARKPSTRTKASR